MDPLQTPFTYFILAVLLLAIAVISYVLLRRRKRVWQRFARRHRLDFLGGGLPEQTEVRGSVENRPFRLYHEERSSDRGVLGVEEITLRLGILGSIPPGLRIRKKRISEEIDENFLTGDQDFDENVKVEAQDPEQLRSYLNQQRRQAVLRLIQLSDPDRSGVDIDAVYVTEREMLSNLPHLEERLAELLDIARILDNPLSGRGART